jgi:hypothetical protein
LFLIRAARVVKIPQLSFGFLCTLAECLFRFLMSLAQTMHFYITFFLTTFPLITNIAAGFLQLPGQQFGTLLLLFELEGGG